MRMKAMKRYLLPILVVLVLASGLPVGCGQDASPKPFPAPESEGEETPAATPDNRESVPQAPKIYEKDIPHVNTIPHRGITSRMVPTSTKLKFWAEAGNRIEGEVIVNEYYLEFEASAMSFKGNPYSLDYAYVHDPYGNNLLQWGVSSNYRNPHHWQFAFIAATTGEYEASAGVGCPYHEYISNPPSIVGTIRVTVYDK